VVTKAGIKMKKILLVIIFTLISSVSVSKEDKLHPKHMNWSFDGFFGTFDKQSAQRGFQVYKEVCSACHGLRLVAFRNLEEIGFSKLEVKALASDIDVIDGPNDEGEMFERPGIPSDLFPDPYPNEQAERAANNGACPPDLSLITKARADGPNYIYSLLTGYGKKIPSKLEVGEGMHYNPYFPGMQIAMAEPLSEDIITYQDGTPATVDRMSRDLVNFLQWAAEPEMEKRNRMGIKVLIYLVLFTFLFYQVNKRVWARIKKK
jgi:ubiquinol-cytochrome c reductase cytochrome c1 subunit